MTLRDISISAVFVIFGLRGLFRWLIREAASITAILLGGWLAYRFHEPAAVVFAGALPVSAARVVSFILLLLIAGLASHLIGNLLEKVVKLALLGWVNRAAGIFLGLLEGGLLLAMVFYAVTAVPFRFQLKESIEKHGVATQLAQFGGILLDRAKSLKATSP